MLDYFITFISTYFSLIFVYKYALHVDEIVEIRCYSDCCELHLMTILTGAYTKTTVSFVTVSQVYRNIQVIYLQ